MHIWLFSLMDIFIQSFISVRNCGYFLLLIRVIIQYFYIYLVAQLVSALAIGNLYRILCEVFCFIFTKIRLAVDITL